jgi:CRISPR-associated exonuclease Cas4
LLVAFDEELRKLTTDTATAARAMIADNRTPPPVLMPACKRCSMEAVCQPKRLQKPPGIARWLAGQIGD